MNLSKSRLLIFGGIGALLLGIGVVILVVQNTQKSQELRSKAAPATVVSLSPSSTNVSPGQQVSLTVMIDTGGNQVVSVSPYLTFDPAKLSVVSFVQSAAFPQVTSQPQFGFGTAAMSVSSQSFAQPVSGTAQVATITFQALAGASGNTTVQFSSSTFVGTLSGGETNDLVGATPATITFGTSPTPPGTANDCNVSFALTLPSPTPTPTLIPTPTRTPTPIPTNTPIPTPTRTPTPTNTPVPTATSTPLPSMTPVPTPTRTPTPTNTPIPTNTPVPTNTPIPTNTPVPTATSIPTPTPTVPAGPQCIAIRVYLNGTQVTNLSTLQPGQTIVFGVASGPFGTNARITINGTGPFEFSTKNTVGEFIYTYTIPTTATSVSAQAQIFAQGQWN